MDVNRQLSEQKAKELLSYKFETETLEFKESFDLSSPRDVVELAKDVLAIANSGGGHIVVGVEDETFKVVGISEVEATLLANSNRVNDKFSKYHGNYVSLNTAIHEVESGTGRAKVALIHIGQAREKIPAQSVGAYPCDENPRNQRRPISAGDLFIRKGASSQKVLTPKDTVPGRPKQPSTSKVKPALPNEPLSQNPYDFVLTAGATTFKGREREINQLLAKISSSTHVALWGLQRIGKTSLFREARKRSLQEGRSRVKFAEIDLQGLGADRRLTYRTILEEIVCALSEAGGAAPNRSEIIAGLDSLIDGRGARRGGRASYLQSYELALEKILSRSPDRYVLFVDEFSELCKTVAWRSQMDVEKRDTGATEHPHEMVADIALMRWFSSLLRNQNITSKLTFVIAVRPFVAEFDRQSDLQILKLTAPIHLFHLDEASAKALINSPVAPYLRYEKGAAEYLYNITDGHPYLIQFILKEIVDTCLATGRERILIKDVKEAEWSMISEGPVYEAQFAVLDSDYGIDETLNRNRARLGKGVLACIAKEGHSRSEGWVPKNHIVKRLTGFDVTAETTSSILSQLLGAKIVQESVQEDSLCYRVSVPLLRKRYVKQNMYLKYFE